MITKEKFAAINDEVNTALTELFQRATGHFNFGLLLAHAENVAHIDHFKYNENPHIINFYLPQSRISDSITFLNKFLREHYSFKCGSREDKPEIILSELLIYLNLWESKPFLSILFRLITLSKENTYEWVVEFSSRQSTCNFILKKIKEPSKNNGLLLYDIIDKAYHSSIRNAAAHSEFHLDVIHPRINLDNYRGEQWEISTLKYEEWSERFSYTFLLFYRLFEMFLQTRRTLPENTNFPCYLKDKNGKDILGYLNYFKESDSFSSFIGK